MSVLVENVQRFCLHDGPGIRTTVFLKGCAIRCPWCANPENLIPEISYYLQKTKCAECNGTCLLNPECKIPKIKESYCTESDYKKCPLCAIRKSGEWWSSSKLFGELVKDQDYFKKEGGVTFSGGEPLLWANEIKDVLEKLKEKEIHIAFETSLFVDIDLLKTVIKYIDLFIVDIKIFDREKCREILHGNLDEYVTNLNYLFEENSKVVIRFPLVPLFTYTKSNIDAVVNYLRSHNPEWVEIFSVHNLAENKYKNMGINYNKFDTVSFEDLNIIKKYIEQNAKVKVKINSL